MPRIMKTIYVSNDDDAERVQKALESAALLAPTLDWDVDWEAVDEEETVECPVCHSDQDWDLTNCEDCGAPLRKETEDESPQG